MLKMLIQKPQLNHFNINFILYLYNPIIHLFYLPAPPLHTKNCVGILLDFSWDIFMSQEKLQTIIMQNCGATTEVCYGIVQVEMMMMNDDETFI